MSRSSLLFTLAFFVLMSAGCPPEDPSVSMLSGDLLRDPQSCVGCHETSVQTWERSGHAQSSTRPIFVAALAKAQREAPADVVQACVRCHIPMAPNDFDVASDAELWDSQRGVTCFACHGASSIVATKNNGVVVDDDSGARLRGKSNALNTSIVHQIIRTAELDRRSAKSSALCSSCHQAEIDGLAFKQIGAQYQESIFADPVTGTSCAGCHLVGRDHNPFRPAEDDDSASFDALDFVVAPELCVESIGGGVEVTVRLENFGAAHAFPADHHRRAWVEVTAFLGDTIFFESGSIGDDEPTSVAAAADPNLWTIHDVLRDDAGDEVNFPWEATVIEERSLVAARGTSPLDPAYEDLHQTRTYFFVGPVPDVVTLRVHYRSLSLDYVDALIASGDLDANERDRVTTTSLAGSEITWTPALGRRCLPSSRR